MVNMSMSDPLFVTERASGTAGGPSGFPVGRSLLVSFVLSVALAGCVGSPDGLPPARRLHLMDAEGVAEARDRLPPLRSRIEGGAVLVPNLAPSAIPRDLDAVPVGERKRLFVRVVLPHILFQNAVIHAERNRIAEFLSQLEADVEPARDQAGRIAALFQKYRFRGDPAARVTDRESLRLLLRRVDIIPPSLALAQAAIESGWGLSRFAREGNNIFGHWKTRGVEGMVPDERPEGATYSLAIFSNLSDAVGRYFLNLNTHGAYRGFRDMRAAMRERGFEPAPDLLAAALEDYSARGKDYVIDLVEVMRHNRLRDYDRAQLVRAASTKNVTTTLFISHGGALHREPV